MNIGFYAGVLEMDVSSQVGRREARPRSIASPLFNTWLCITPLSNVVVDQKAREFQYATPGQPLIEILGDQAPAAATARPAARRACP